MKLLKKIIPRAEFIVLGLDIPEGHIDIVPHHLQRAVLQDLLQTEDIPSIHQPVLGKGVAEGVG